MKEMRGREKRGKGKHEFPNISSKCEVYCEKIYDFRYLAISTERFYNYYVYILKISGPILDR